MGGEFIDGSSVTVCTRLYKGHFQKSKDNCNSGGKGRDMGGEGPKSQLSSLNVNCPREEGRDEGKGRDMGREAMLGAEERFPTHFPETRPPTAHHPGRIVTL